MPDPSLGTWLRNERERRGITLKTISDQTKVSAPLLEGLEADNLARWPGGIYRRAFVRAYATALGLNPDEVIRRFEEEHGACTEPAVVAIQAPVVANTPAESPSTSAAVAQSTSRRSRVPGTLADLTVALVLALASAAAGSRLLWPVLLIAAYYALGILLTGTSPMVALLNTEPALPSAHQPDVTDQEPRPTVERRHQPRRNATRAVRTARATRPRVQ